VGCQGDLRRAQVGVPYFLPIPPSARMCNDVLTARSACLWYRDTRNHLPVTRICNRKHNSRVIMAAITRLIITFTGQGSGFIVHAFCADDLMVQLDAASSYACGLTIKQSLHYIQACRCW